MTETLSPKLVALCKLVRVPLVFTSIADSLAGYFISAPAGHYIRFCDVVYLAIISSALYLGGMALNDIVDVEKDRRLQKRRVLPIGLIGIKTAIITSLLLVAIGIMVALLSGLPKPTLDITVIIVLLILLFDVFLKDYEFIGSINMGVIRFFNFLLGVSVFYGVGDFDYTVLVFPVILFFYVFILTSISHSEEKPQQPATKSLFIFKYICLMLCILSLNVFFKNLLAGTVLSVALVAFLITHLATSVKDLSREVLDISVKVGVIAIIPFDAIILIGYGRYWYGVLILVLLLPTLVLDSILKTTEVEGTKP